MKKTILGIGLCILLLLSRCAQKNSKPSESTTIPPTDQSDGLTKPEDSDDASSPAEEKTAAPADAKQVDWRAIQGKIKGVYPAGGSNVLIFADQITLYDLAAGSAAATAEKEALSSVQCWTLDNGYVIAGVKNVQGSNGLGLTSESSGSRFGVILYDKNLMNRSELNLSKMTGDDDSLMSFQALAFSSDGSSIAYATMRGLYLYDRQSDKRTTLIDFTSEDNKERCGISLVEQVGFTNDGKSIAFKAQSFDVPAVIGKPSFDTVGTISTDGTGLTNKRIDGYAVKELNAYTSRLLVAEDFTTADGRVMVMDSKSGDQKIYDLTDKKEGGNICGSDAGRYFASSVATKTGWMVRIYDAETGKLIKEQSISNDGQELYGANDPAVCVLDETRTCFVLLGNKQDSVDTKIEMISF